MNVEKNVFLASLIVIFIGLILFSIIFLSSKALKKKEYLLKTQFNSLYAFANFDKFKYLKILSEQNKDFLPLISKIENVNTFFKTQCDIVKEKLILLTETNFNFSFIKANKLINEITNDLKYCDTIKYDLLSLNTNFTKYYDEINKILLEYRIITDEAIEFYEQNLSLKYNFPIFKTLNNKIVDSFLKTYDSLKIIDQDKLINCINNLDYNISTFVNTIHQVYVLDNILFYIKTNLKNINEYRNNKETIISSGDIVLLEQIEVNIKSNILEIENDIKAYKFSTAMNLSFITINKLDEGLKIIKYSDKLNSLISASLNFIKQRYNFLKKNAEVIKSNFQQIVEYFKNDKKMVNELNKINILFTSIHLALQQIISTAENKKEVDKTLFLSSLYEQLNNLKTLFNMLQDIAAKAKHQIDLFADLYEQISDLKLILLQLKYIDSNTNNKQDSSEKDEVNKLILLNMQTLEKMENKLLHADYSIDGYFKQIKEELTNINSNVEILTRKISSNDSLKMITERLYMYASKHRNESNENKDILETAKKYFINKQYKEALNLLLEFLSQIDNRSY